MAEVVQSHVEDMLPEVYELQQLGILSPHEAKTVIKTRTDFEYKMRRRISKKDDFLKFIDYELKLEKLKQSRISKMGASEISEGARYRSLQRIHFIFQKCLRKYKTDVFLWIRYLQFCKEVNSSRSLGLAFVESLKYNPKCIKIWIMSAKNEMESNKNITAARSIFMQGIKLNEKSVQMWSEYFRLEALYVEKLQKRQQIMQACDKQDVTLNSGLLDFKIAKIVFKNALKNIDLTQDAIDAFVNITKSLDVETNQLLLFLYQTSLKMYPHFPFLWVSLASHILPADPSKSITVLETALSTIPTLTCLKEVLKFVMSNQDKFVGSPLLIQQFCSHGLDKLSVPEPESAIELGEMLLEHSEDNLCNLLIEKSLEAHPRCLNLWLFRIRKLSGGTLEELQEANKAIVSSPELKLEFLNALALTDPDKCRKEWEAVIKETYSSSLISDYLGHVHASSGMDETRKVFQEIQNWHSLPEGAHKLIIDLEISCSVECDVVCNQFDILTSHFGTLDNWGLYLKYCRENCAAQLASVIWRCKKVFTESQVAILTSRL